MIPNNLAVLSNVSRLIPALAGVQHLGYANHRTLSSATIFKPVFKNLTYSLKLLTNTRVFLLFIFLLSEVEKPSLTNALSIVEGALRITPSGCRFNFFIMVLCIMLLCWSVEVSFYFACN